MNCSICGGVVPIYLRYCAGCGSDVGFPNVRMAEQVDEMQALAKRVGDADTSANAKGCRLILDEFRDATNQSEVVIARSLEVVHDMLKSENTLYVGYYRQVASGARLAEDNMWDRGRNAADSTVSPHFYSDLVWGSLTLNGRGISSFGPYSIVLKEKMIGLRSVVFEENPFAFCIKHKITAGQGAPAGYRATWSERGQLAKAKLHATINAATTKADFPKVLLDDSDPRKSAEFIEVHIYGAIHRSAIARVVGPRPSGGSKLVIWKSVAAEINKLGAKMEIV